MDALAEAERIMTLVMERFIGAGVVGGAALIEMLQLNTELAKAQQLKRIADALYTQPTGESLVNLLDKKENEEE
jgi:hypothetical protein